MLKIDNSNNITLTRGDTLTLTLALKAADGSDYTPEEGDSIRFAISIGYTHESRYELVYSKAIPTDSLTFTIPADTTKELQFAEYNFDVEITHEDGAVDTVISGKLKLTGEVK